MRTELLYCGHHDDADACGTCRDPGTGWRICKACAADAERASMAETGRAGLYLVNDNAHLVMRGSGFRRVTDWLGGLSFDVYNYRFSRRGGGFGSPREDFDFNGPDGYVWHGTVRGDSQLARCKRTKKQHSTRSF